MVSLRRPGPPQPCAAPTRNGPVPRPPGRPSERQAPGETACRSTGGRRDRRRLPGVIDPKSTFEDLPRLTDAVAVVAFEGWNDAGDAATGAVEHLELIWDATPLAALDPEDYYDFQVNPPTVSLVGGGARRLEGATPPVSGGPPAPSEP